MRDVIYGQSLRCVKSLKAPFFGLKRSICPDEMSSSIKGEITVTTFDRQTFVRIEISFCPNTNLFIKSFSFIIIVKSTITFWVFRGILLLLRSIL